MLDQMRSPEGKAQLLNSFKGRSVLLTNLTTGLGDRVATPFDPDFPTSEVHLHLLNMLPTEQLLRDPTALQARLCLVIPTASATAVPLTGGTGMIMPTLAVMLGSSLRFLQSGLNRGGPPLPAPQ